MPGTLYVVATPIGNLEDVTLRALRILREVPLVAAEDTRRTARLLQHYSISTRTTSLHEHNERAKTPGLVERLRAGDSIALVSDAGTPMLADPGAYLVRAAHAAGVRVEPIPGPSAAVAALSASGVHAPEFTFVGFPPAKTGARRKWLERLSREPRPVVMYEAPHRIAGTLADIREIFGNRPICVGRELTKAHEQLVISTTLTVSELLPEPRGEYTVIVSAAAVEASVATEAPSPSSVAAEFGHLTNQMGFERRAALRQIATRHHRPVREIFSLLEQSK
jgi:16S rRNA (cytidine1402-2'-O)-methyltransferase